jgi:hypothetical protein
MEGLNLIISGGVTASLIAAFAWWVKKWMSGVESTLAKMQEVMALIDKVVSVMQEQNTTIGKELQGLNKWMDDHDLQLRKHGEQIARLEENVKKK